VQLRDQPPGEALDEPGEQQDDDDARDADQRRARIVIQLGEELEDAVQR